MTYMSNTSTTRVSLRSRTSDSDDQVLVATATVYDGDDDPRLSESESLIPSEVRVVAHSEVSQARQRWLADEALFSEVTRCFYSNQLAAAEELCRTGMTQPPLPAEHHVASNGDRFRDTRGSVAMIYALLSTTRGIMSMERDNLSKALPGLFAADRLLQESEVWVAQQLMRGVCEASIGGVMLAQRRIVKGAWRMLKAYGALRHVSISSMLHFEGMESRVVRSTALYFLGTKALITELLPPAVVRRLPGFSGSSGWEQGLQMLRQCRAEGGLFKPMAMDTLLIFHIGFAETLLIPRAAADWDEIASITAEADALFGPTSMITAPKIAACLGLRRDAAAGLARVSAAAADPRLACMPMLEGMLQMDAVNYCLALLQWRDAAQRMRAIVQGMLSRKKKSGVPTVCNPRAAPARGG